jgi:hypothetical protein
MSKDCRWDRHLLGNSILKTTPSSADAPLTRRADRVLPATILNKVRILTSVRRMFSNAIGHHQKAIVRVLCLLAACTSLDGVLVPL